MRSIISIIGKPGAGKTTLAAWLSRKLDSRLVDLGCIVRDFLRTPEGSQWNDAVKQGQLLSDSLVHELYKGSLNEQVGDVILTGYPRTVGQLQLFLKSFTESNQKLCFLYLNIPDSVAESRMHGRVEHAVRKKAAIRDDDSLKIFRARLLEYQRKTEPVIEQVRQLGLNLLEVDAVKMKKQLVALWIEDQIKQ